MARLLSLLFGEYEKVTSWMRKQMKPNGGKSMENTKRSSLYYKLCLYFLSKPCIYIIAWKRFWRLDTKLSSPLGQACCQAFLVSTDICCIKWTDQFWHQPTAAPLWSRLSRSQGGNLADRHLKLGTACMVTESTHSQSLLQRAAVSSRDGNPAAVLKATPKVLGMRETISGWDSRKLPWMRAQVSSGSLPPIEPRLKDKLLQMQDPRCGSPRVKQMPPPDPTKVSQTGLCAQDHGLVAGQWSQPHHSCHLK